jgi:ABC-type glycerol-3-phosphate transport system substrate-binding protein
MLEIEFSFIEDAPGESRGVFNQLLDEFRDKYKVQVRLTTMSWERAWPDLFEIALNGKGPDVSHIGSTWISSLVAMNALRLFSPRELAALGGAQAFSAPVWQSAVLEGGGQVWAVPWMAYIYLVCYRRDLLQQAGIEQPGSYLSAEGLAALIQELRKTGIEFPWLMPSVPPPYTDLLHTAANWVWGGGGDFLTPDGQRTLFSQAAAIAGLKAYFEAYRQVGAASRQFQASTCLAMFAQGRAAALVTDIRSVLSLLAGGAAVNIRENIGTAAPSPVPWFGGSNLVIWRHTQGYPEREKAALSLVAFLASKPVQIAFSQQVGTMPARLDALAELFPPTHPLAAALAYASEAGRYYPSTAMWRRIEFQLSGALQDVWADSVRDATSDLGKVLHNHLDPLAHRLDLTLRR